MKELGDHSTEEGLRKLSHVDTALTRDFFQTLAQPLTKRCLEVCQMVMTEAKLEPKQIDAVLLVGGMTRVPLVRQLVTDYFGKAPVGGVNPDEVVALGAAVHAAELGQKQGAALLIDVAREEFATLVLATHDPAMLAMMQEHIALADINRAGTSAS